MLKAGDKLKAAIECPACGGDACMSVTKNNTIFAYCKNVVDEETGEKCGYRGFLGRTKSRDIIRQYNESIKQEKLDNAEPQNVNEGYTKRSEEGAGETSRADDTGAGSGSGSGEAAADPQPRKSKSIGAALLGSVLGGESAFD